MNGYVTKQQLINFFNEDELIQRTDHAQTGMIDDVVLAEAVTAAEKLIDGYLMTVYSLPLSPETITASSLPEKCADIARYYLYDDLPTDTVIARYKDAIAWLKDVQAKRVSLGVTDNSVAPIGNTIVKQGASRFNWSNY